METKEAVPAEVNEKGMPRKEVRSKDRAIDGGMEDMVSLQAAEVEGNGLGPKGPD